MRLSVIGHESIGGVMAAVVLAQMWDRDNHMGDGWWWLMGVGWLLFLALIGFLAYLLVRHITEARGPQPGRSSAEELLAERLARGEIDEDEYRRRRDALRG